MAKVSPILRSFNGGEFSRLMDGRSDIDRYPSSMRKLLNYVALPQGPAIGRSGTMFVTAVRDHESRTALFPFVFSETQSFILEFSNMKMRVILRDGPLLAAPGVPFEIDTPFNQTEIFTMRLTQSGDVVYITSEGRNVYKLSRLGALIWTLEAVVHTDGPFMPINATTTRLYPSSTGQIGVTELETGISSQFRTVEYTLSSPGTLSGYYIKASGPNDDPTYTSLDRAPSTWLLEGLTGGTWVPIDSKQGHVLYDNRRTPFFKVADDRLYTKFRITVTELRRNGTIQPAFTVFFGSANTSISIVSLTTAGINNDRGFLPTDVGRLIRYKSVSDGVWVVLRIDVWNSPTGVTTTPLGAPLSDTNGTADWRLGYWSGTTGFPTTSTFFEDRLWFGGSRDFPDLLVGSVIGAYDSLAQSDETGTVSDDNAVAFRLNSRRISRIAWIATDERGLLVGTGSSEWVLTGGDRESVITARSIKARSSTQRGSAQVEPVKVDRQILFVQRSGRTVREMTYVYEADGYKTPSMSLFSSHIGTSKLVEMDYAAEPHSIIWFRRDDGTVAGLTYNRDENVVGWHTHDFAGGFVESIAVIPTAEGEQDTLWLVVRRRINGRDKRYVERLTRFWDFQSSLDDCHLVDCAVRYTGDPVDVVSGLDHLEGEEVYGLADGSPFESVVFSGAIHLDTASANIIVGLPYDAIGVSNRLEAGAADGTSQGKTKRIHSAKVRFWQSVGGLIGKLGPDGEEILVEIESRYPDDATGAVPLRDLDYLVDWPAGYDSDCFVVFKRDGKRPLPLNVIAIMPQLVTQDGG